MEESDPDPAVAAGQRSSLLENSVRGEEQVVNAECNSSGMEIEFATWKGTSTGPSPGHSSSGSSSSSSISARTTISKFCTESENVKVYVKRKSRDAGGVHLFESPLKKQNVDSLAGGSKDAVLMVEPLRTPTSMPPLEAVLSETSQDMVVNVVNNNNNNNTQNVSSNHSQMENAVLLPKRMSTCALSVCTTTTLAQPRLLKERSPAMMGEAPPGVTEPTLSSSEVERDRSEVKLMIATVKGEEEEQPSSSTAGGLIQSQCRNFTVTPETNEVEVTAACIVMNEQAAVSNSASKSELITAEGDHQRSPIATFRIEEVTTSMECQQSESNFPVPMSFSCENVDRDSQEAGLVQLQLEENGIVSPPEASKPVVVPVLIMTDDDQVAASNGPSKIEQITAEFDQSPATTLRIKEVLSSEDCQQLDDKPPVLLGSYENVHAEEVGLVQSSEVENATVYPEASRTMAAAASFTVTDDQAPALNGPSEIKLATAAGVDHCPITPLGMHEVSAPVESMQLEEAKVPNPMGSAENAHGDLQEAALVSQSVGLLPESRKAVTDDAFLPTDDPGAALNGSSEVQSDTAKANQFATSTLGIEEVSAPVDSMQSEAKLPGLESSHENVQGESQEASFIHVESEKVAALLEAHRPPAAPLVVAADGQVAPADDQVAPANGQVMPTNGHSNSEVVTAEEDQCATTSRLRTEEEVSVPADCMQWEAKLPGVVSSLEENVHGKESQEASVSQAEFEKVAVLSEGNRPATDSLLVTDDGQVTPANRHSEIELGTAEDDQGGVASMLETAGISAPVDCMQWEANLPGRMSSSCENLHGKASVIQVESDKVACLLEPKRLVTDDGQVPLSNGHSQIESVTAEADQDGTFMLEDVEISAPVDCMQWEAKLPGAASNSCENVHGAESQEASHPQLELEKSVCPLEEGNKSKADLLLVTDGQAVASSGGPCRIELVTAEAVDQEFATSTLGIEEASAPEEPKKSPVPVDMSENVQHSDSQEAGITDGQSAAAASEAPSGIVLVTGELDQGGTTLELQTEEEVSAPVECKQLEGKLEAPAAVSCENECIDSQEGPMHTVANSEILEEGACINAAAAAFVSSSAKPEVVLSAPPKAKRTPLTFWPLETHALSNHHVAAGEVSNSISSPASPVASNLGSPFLPARRSPLPIPVVQPPSSSNSTNFQVLGSVENLSKQQNTCLQGEEERQCDQNDTELQTSTLNEQAVGRQGFVWQGKEEPDIVADIKPGANTDANKEEGEESESAISEENVHVENPLLVAVRSTITDDDPAVPGVCSQNLMEEENGHMMSDEEEEADNMDVAYEEEEVMTQAESPIYMGDETPPVQYLNQTTSLLVQSENQETGGTSITQQFSQLYPDHEGVSSVRRVRSIRKSSLCSKCMVLKKGHHKCPPETGSTDREASLERQDSVVEVSGPPVHHPPLPPPQQSARLKVRLRVKPPVENMLKEVPITAKQLLATGLLEGHHVRYVGRGGDVMLTGIIQGGGVQCDCRECRGLQVINVSAFEKHAGSSNRHPSDFIFIENGKCLRDILKAGWNAGEKKLNVLEVIKAAIGEIIGNNNRKRKPCFKCGSRDGRLVSCAKGGCSNTFHQDCVGTLASDRLCPKCESAEKTTKTSLDKRSIAVVAAQEPVQMVTRVESTKEVVSSTKEPVSSTMELVSSSNREPVSMTEGSTHEIREPSFYKALFLPGGLPDDTEVGYYVKGQCFLTGVKKGAGIYCNCCQQMISCRLFEQHAGWAARCNPYRSIYLAADGRSLHLAAQSLMGQQKLKKLGIAPRPDESMVYCNECGDGGELLLCTSCPRSYHEDCAGLRSAPPSAGDWYCPQCQQQQAGISDSKDDLTVKEGVKKTGDIVTNNQATCTRLLKVPEGYTIGRCVLCKSVEFDKSGFGRMTILLCYQCEQEYHVGCLKELGLANLTELPEGDWFCGQDCKHIHSILSLLVANGPEPVADSIVGQVLERKQQQEDDSRNGDVRKKQSFFEWQLLHGRRGDSTNGRTLAEAVEIFRESFSMNLDERPRDDLIPFMVYSRNCQDQEYVGMYCVVLKHNDKVVSAALVRIFGRQLAEVPLVATSSKDQGQGNCKALMLSIERLLGVLHVKHLVLSAAAGAEDIWLTKFGFNQISDLQLQKLTFNVPMMMFSGSSILGKDIMPLAID
ncbi:unnamed protein product [Sphagnum compactum]